MKIQTVAFYLKLYTFYLLRNECIWFEENKYKGYFDIILHYLNDKFVTKRE